MRKRIYRNYILGICICLMLFGLGWLPFLFLTLKDAVVLQSIYYVVLFGISLLMTAMLATVRMSYDTFDRSGLPYCLAGILNIVLASIGLYIFFQVGWSLWVLIPGLIFIIGIFINRDILKQLNTSSLAAGRKSPEN